MTTARVSDAMLRAPIVLPGSASVAEVGEVFASSHVHLVPLTETGALGSLLVGALERDDLASADPTTPARLLGPLAGRTVEADLPAEDVRVALLAAGRRRAAVVDDAGRLVGLLCLKRHGGGFCTDAGVASRRAERRAQDGEGPARAGPENPLD